MFIVIVIVSAWAAQETVHQTAVAYGQPEGYSASVRWVAGGPELPEVYMFEDNYARCYIVGEDMACLGK